MRSHFSSKPLHKVFGVTNQTDWFKPEGLWYTFEGDWASWCEGDEFRLDHLTYETQLELDTTKILQLSNAEDIRKFGAEYRQKSEICPYMHLIGWKRVAADYGGIETSPYCYEYEVRFDRALRWYHAWDCASGCVWDIEAIVSIGKSKLTKYAKGVKP